MMQSGTFCQKKSQFYNFWRKMLKSVQNVQLWGRKAPKNGKWRKMAHVANLCCSCQRTAIDNNRGESRRIEENRGESRRIEENRGESRRIEENRGEKEMKRKRARKRQRDKKKAGFDILAGFAKFVIHFHSVITCFANFRPSPKLHIFTHFLRCFPLSAFFTFFPSFSANFSCFAPVFHPFSAEFSRFQHVFETFTLFSPCFPNFSPHFTPKQTEFAGEKTRKQYFQEIVPGFCGDFVYVLFHPKMKEPQEHVNTFLPPTQSVDNPQSC